MAAIDVDSNGFFDRCETVQQTERVFKSQRTMETRATYSEIRVGQCFDGKTIKCTYF